MTKTLKIVYFGNETLASGTTTTAPVLRSLLTSEHNVCSIVVHETTSKSRTYKKPAVIELAETHSIPVHNPTSLLDIADVLAAYQADVGVLAAYGKIVPEQIINLFPAGIVNIHPSLLPRYRGPTPIEQALLDNQSATGVSLMALVAQLDAGPVYIQRSVEFGSETSKQVLTDRLAANGAELLSEHLVDIVSGTLKPASQDEAAATYTAKLAKSDGILDFSKPAERLAREVIAFANWPKSRCILGRNLEVIIHAAESVDVVLPPGKIDTQTGSLLVGSSNGSLAITSLQPLGKNNISAQDFLRGYRQLLSEKVLTAAER